MVAQRTLYLVRHGQYDTSVRTPDGGSLTEIGKQQAEYVAKAIKELPITSIYASTMVRAIETGNIIAQAKQMNYAVSDLLREGLPSIPPRIATQILEMMAYDPNLTHESIHEDGQRADEAFTHFFAPSKNDEDAHDVLACHGNLIRYLTSKALGVTTDTWAKLNINHCSITTVMVDENGALQLHSYNETGHLPAAMKTE